MITSKEIINISEEYLMRVRDVMIYVNPTSSDYQKLYSVNSYHVIRFTADIQTKNVYVWDGLENLMHGEAAHNIGIYNSYISNKMYNTKLFMGIAIVSGSGPSVFCLCRTGKEAMAARKKLFRSVPALERNRWQVFIARTAT